MKGMKSLVVGIFIFSFNCVANSCLQFNCLESRIDHFTEVLVERDISSPNLKKNSAPKILLTALDQISKSPLGFKIYKKSQELQKKFKFIQVTEQTDPDYAVAFRVGFDNQGENAIHYSVNVEKWKEITLSGKPEKVGEEISTSTLATLIAHEFGHTEIGLKAFSFEKHPISSFKDVVKSEVIAVKHFENIFRQKYGIPLRRTYFKEGDVFSQALKLSAHFEGRSEFTAVLPFLAL